jgi:hypothetical protein
MSVVFLKDFLGLGNEDDPRQVEIEEHSSFIRGEAASLLQLAEPERAHYFNESVMEDIKESIEWLQEIQNMMGHGNEDLRTIRRGA